MLRRVINSSGINLHCLPDTFICFWWALSNLIGSEYFMHLNGTAEGIKK